MRAWASLGLAAVLGVGACDKGTNSGEKVTIRDTVLVAAGGKIVSCTVLDKFSRDAKTLVTPETTTYPLDGAGKCPIPDPTESGPTTCSKTVMKETKTPATWWLVFASDSGGVALLGVQEADFKAATEGKPYVSCK